MILCIKFLEKVSKNEDTNYGDYFKVVYTSSILINDQKIDFKFTEEDGMGVTLEIKDGNSLDEIYEVISCAKDKSFKGKPIAVLMKTVMGNGVDFMMHTHDWHGKAPNDEQLEIALSQNPETIGDY